MKYRPLTRLVRSLTAWAWRQEIAALGGAAILKEMSMNEEAMELKIALTPGLGTYIGQTFASMVAQSPNYTEMQFQTHGKINGKYEFVTVTVQKEQGKTPHTLRREAEAEMAKWKLAAESNRGEIDAAWNALELAGSGCWDGTAHTTLAEAIKRLKAKP